MVASFSLLLTTVKQISETETGRRCFLFCCTISLFKYLSVFLFFSIFSFLSFFFVLLFFLFYTFLSTKFHLFKSSFIPLSRHCFEIITPNGSRFILQAESDAVEREWCQALTKEKERLFTGEGKKSDISTFKFGKYRTMTDAVTEKDDEDDEDKTRFKQILYANPSNRYCADCGAECTLFFHFSFLFFFNIKHMDNYNSHFNTIILHKLL